MLPVLMEETMDYDSFVSTVHLIMKERMGEGYDVRICKVLKNNSQELHSLVIRKEELNIAPNIYLKPYYEAYLEGVGLVELMDRLCMLYQSCPVPELDHNFSYTLEEMKPYIFYRLVSYDRNQKLLASVPHLRYLDLAITFHCLVRDDEEGIGTIRITNEHMKLWEITPDKLRELAVRNTQKLFPATIRSMEEVLLGMLPEALPDEFNDLKTLGLDKSLMAEEGQRARMKMYILTNKKGINGASCLLYKDVIRTFAKQLKSDLYLLPSSIHEIILIPQDRDMRLDTLSKMVEEVNRTQVADEEVLSDHVYYYSLETDTILI